MKRILSFILAIVMVLTTQAFVIAAESNSITITTSSPWFEAGYVEWADSSNAGNYNVYYKKATDSDAVYTKVDSELVRGSRVDIIGLLGETTYDVKIVPVVLGSENTSEAATTQITPMKYTREGFAFSKNSPHKNTTGGYNLDGTVKDGAKIYYISEETKNTVKDTVSKGSSSIECTGIGEIMAARESAKSTQPIILRIIGQVTAPAGVDSLSLLNFKAIQNVTIEGVGEDATVYGWGLNIRDTQNIEVRNLAFSQFPDDAVSIQTDNINVWVHNNDFFIGKNGGGDKKKGDGSCDVKDDSTYVTVSYNNFHSSGKTSLCGMKSETAGVGYVTYHHNWYNKSGSRHPRIRTITVHSYNNYYDHNYSGGIGATTGASAFLESNYFEDTVRPMFMAGQGNDLKEDGSSFSSGENGGVIKAYGNKLTTCGKEVTYLNSELAYVTQTCKGVTYFNGYGKAILDGVAAGQQPDAYGADTRDEKVPDTFYAYKGGAKYSNFDTNPDIMYDYTPDTPDEAKAKVVAYAGRVRNLDPKKPLVAPENPAVSINSDGSAILKWDAVLGAAYYKVAYSVDGVLKGSEEVEGLNFSVPNIVLTENQEISFTVSAVKPDGSIGSSSSGSAKYVAPAAPTNLKITKGNATLTATWSESAGASAYEVSISDGTNTSTYTTSDTNYGFNKLTNGTTYTISVKAITGKLASSAVTATETAVCYISEDNLDYKVVQDDFDNYDDETGYNPDFEKYTATYDTSNSSLGVSATSGTLVIKDNSTTANVAVSRKFTPIKKGRFSAEFDFTVGEKPNGANNFVRYMSGSNVVFALTLSSQAIFVNSGDGASVSSGKPQGTTKATGVKLAAGKTCKIKFVGDIDSKTYDLYLGGVTEPIVKGAELVLADNFGETGINELIIQTSASKAHNFTVDNFSVYGSDVEGIIDEPQMLDKVSNINIDINKDTKEATATWDAVEGAESYDITYYLNDTVVKTENVTNTYCTASVTDIKNGDVVKFAIVAKATGFTDSFKAVKTQTYSEGQTPVSPSTEKVTETTTEKATETTTMGRILYGDVNRDDVIDMNDVVALLDYVLDKAHAKPVNRKIADVNGDKIVDAEDVSNILHKVLDSKFTFPVGEDYAGVGGKSNGDNKGNTGDKGNTGSGETSFWDIGSSAFASYTQRDSFPSKEAVNVNGLYIYYPASGVTAASLTATDGTVFTANIKLNSITAAITKKPSKNTIAVNVKAGDVISLYATAGKEETIQDVYFTDSSFSTTTVALKGKKQAPIKFKAEKDGLYYIYSNNSMLVYGVKLN